MSVLNINAQERLTVMQYNLTYYGSTDNNFPFDCNTTTNNTLQKDGYLKTIVDNIRPDVFCVNELMVKYASGENTLADTILIKVMGNDFERAAHTGSKDITNMIFFNKTKLGLHKQDYLFKDLDEGNIVREIDFYTLYYKDAALSIHQDSIYMTFVVAHLKAGRDGGDSIQRVNATLTVMDYIENNNLGKNVFFMGDLNTYSNEEQAYQNLTNYTNNDVNFYDPIDQEGEWNNNYSYRMYHTQSTRSNFGDCFASGGMDDRFDFILINNDVRDNSSGVQYVQGSYKAFGQDGSFYNSSVNTNSNSVVSSTVAQALYEMSDHLPVVLELDVTQGPLSVDYKKIVTNVALNNPFSEELKVRINAREILSEVEINIYDITGKLVISKNIAVNNNRFYQSINTKELHRGVYILSIIDKASKTSLTTEKLIKQ